MNPEKKYCDVTKTFGKVTWYCQREKHPTPNNGGHYFRSTPREENRNAEVRST